jgi:hypothetical protein
MPAENRFIGFLDAMKSPNPYGGTRDEAIARVEALGLRVLAERIEQA